MTPFRLPARLVALPGRPPTRVRLGPSSAVDVGRQVWLTLEEAATYMRVSYRCVQRLVEERRHTRTAEYRFPCVRRGHRWLVRREDLDKWLLRGER